jgi:hypothetical protein
MTRTGDSRAFPRFEVRIPGKLLWASGTCTSACRITDLSESGARVDTAVFTSVPERIDLFEAKTGNIFECVVRWQCGTQIGLQFVDLCSRSKRRALIEQHGLHVMPESNRAPDK